MTKTLPLFCIGWFLLTLNLYGQKKQYLQFSIEQGLPQSQIADISKDEVGYLYMATQGGGLARFDGNEFKIYSKNEGLESNYINALYATNDSLLIGTNAGLSIKVRDSFINYKSPKILKITKLQQRWYFGTSQGVYVLINNYLQPLKANQKIDLSPVNDLINFDQYFWIASPTGLWKIRSFDNNSKAELLVSGNFTSLLRTQNGVLAGSQNQGLLFFENNNRTKTIKEIIEINNLGTIDDEIWVATENHGVFFISDQIELKEKIFNKETGLATNAINIIIKDHQNSIWIASNGFGAFKEIKPKFKHFDAKNGLMGTRVNALSVSSKSLWISNSQQQLIQKDSLGFHLIKNSLIQSKITSIATDSTNAIWVTTAKNGLFIYRENPAEIDSPMNIEGLNSSNGLHHDELLQVVSSKKDIWIATMRKGILKLNYNFKDEFVQSSKLFNKVQGLNDLEITNLSLENEDKLWYATKNGGLGFINHDQVSHYSEVLNQKTRINTILIHNDHVFIGTQEKGIWFAKTNELNNFIQLKDANDLISSCYQLLFDTEDQLWIGTEKGVIRLKLSESNVVLEAQHFDASDGFLGVETSLNAITKDEKGNIWFGTQRGLSQFIPENVIVSMTTPKLSIEEIKVNFKSIDSIRVDTYAKTLQLKPEENNLSISFKSIDFNHPKKVFYRWKLNNKEYSPWTRQSNVTLANLGSGLYIFNVQSKTNMDLLSPEKTFLFFIDSPFYQKKWFIAIAMSLALLILIISVWYFIHREKTKSKAKFEQLKLENHLLSLEQKALQLQMNPHFIFNVLNGIKALNNSGKTDLVNSTVNQFGVLLRSILENSREEEISLNQEIDTLENYVRLEQQICDYEISFFIQKQAINMDLDEILVPSMLLQPFVENSIKHGRNHQTGKVKIELNITIEKEFLCFSIIDDGKGFVTTQKMKGASSHKSTALKITKERIESLSEFIIFNMEEIKQENQVIGTKVWFKIPLKTDY